LRLLQGYASSGSSAASSNESATASDNQSGHVVQVSSGGDEEWVRVVKCAIYDDSSEVFINSVEIDASTVVHVVLQGRDANAFTSRMGGRGSVPRLLRLKPEDVALTRGKPLAKGKFTWITEAGKSERWVVAQCGNHSVGVYVLAQCLHACTHARTLLHSVLVPLTLNRTKRRTHHILQRRRWEALTVCASVHASGGC
jgi:hypothetical protein